jgi:hypothetical protein
VPVSSCPCPSRPPCLRKGRGASRHRFGGANGEGVTTLTVLSVCVCAASGIDFAAAVGGSGAGFILWLGPSTRPSPSLCPTCGYPLCSPSVSVKGNADQDTSHRSAWCPVVNENSVGSADRRWCARAGPFVCFNVRCQCVSHKSGKLQASPCGDSKLHTMSF